MRFSIRTGVPLILILFTLLLSWWTVQVLGRAAHLQVENRVRSNLIKELSHIKAVAEHSFRDANRPWLQEMVSELRFSRNVIEVVVVDGEGIVLASGDTSHIGQSLEQIPVESDSQHRALRRRLMIEARTSPGGVVETTPDGRTLMGVSSVLLAEPGADPAPDERGTLCIARDLVPVGPEATYLVRWQALSFVLGIVVFACVLGIIFHFLVTRRVETLIEAMRRLAAGDMDTRVRTIARDELGALAESFNQMVGRRREALKALYQLQEIVACSSDMIGLLDKDFNYLTVNEAYAKAFGKAPSDFVGRTPNEFFGDEVFDTTIQSHAERCMAGEKVRYQRWIVFQDEQKYYMDISYSPYVDEAGEVQGFIVIGRDTTERKGLENALEKIARGFSAFSGASFFEQLVHYLSDTLSVKYALVGKIAEGTTDQVATVSVSVDGKCVDNFVYELAGTPCDDVSRGGVCIYPSCVQEEFPEDQLLVDMGVESYVGMPLLDSTGGTLGILVVMDDSLLENTSRIVAMLEIFAIRAASEMERMRHEQALVDSEARYRLLVDQSPFAIQVLTPQGHLSQVNTAWMKLWGASPEIMPHVLERYSILEDEEARALGIMPLIERAFAGEAITLPPIRYNTQKTLRALGLNRMVSKTPWLQSRFYPIKSATGEILDVIGIHEDITEQVEARDKLVESEEKFSKFFYDHPTPMSILDLDTGDRVDLNDSYCRVTGYTREELLSTTVFTRNIWASLDAQELGIEMLKTGGQVSNYPVEIITKSGEIRSCLGFAAILSVGQRNLVIASMLDFTELKKAQADKEEIGARSAAIIEHAVDGIITIDRRGIIDSVNPAALKLFRYSSDDLIGQSVRVLMPEPNRSEHDGHIERYLKGGAPRVLDITREVVGLRKDGATFPMRISVSEVRFGDQRLFTGVVHDLTHERELEKQLGQAQKMESLGTLAGGIAHDFNNILQAILGFANIAQQNLHSDDENLLQWLQEIESGGFRAAELVEQILTFSRKADVETRPVALHTLVTEALRFLRNSIPATVQIESAVDAECGPVSANATQIHQVVTNLCTNAMHAMEEKGGVLRVSLAPIAIDTPLQTLSGTLEPGAYIQLTVVDTGTGIHPDLFGQILDPFFTTKDVGKGTGLGLAMVHGIAKSMGGGLLIDSVLGEGTTIRLLFPESEESLETPTAEQPGETTPIADGGRRHVLIVDDEVAITNLTTLILESRGFMVDAHNDVDSALLAFQSAPQDYDVALLDYTMPKKTGVELARDFYRLNPELPVCLATGRLEDFDKEKTKSPNVVEVMKKPFRANTMLAAINRML